MGDDESVWLGSKGRVRMDWVEVVGWLIVVALLLNIYGRLVALTKDIKAIRGGVNMARLEVVAEGRAIRDVMRTFGDDGK